MKITKAKTAGFCFGVNRAVDMTQTLAESGVKVATMGPLIHNNQAVRRLEAKGVLTLSDLNVSAVSAFVTAALILCGYLFFCKYPMDWQPIKSDMTEKAETIKAELLTLGFPENILRDLSEEEILSMENPIEVAVDVMDHPMNEGREVREVITDGDGRTISISTVYDVKELRVTGIAVRLDGERENWKIIQHFDWVVTPDFSGTESVRIIPASHLDEWDLNSGFSGRLLYDKEGETCTAPYVSLGEERYTSNSIFCRRI